MSAPNTTDCYTRNLDDEDKGKHEDEENGLTVILKTLVWHPEGIPWSGTRRPPPAHPTCHRTPPTTGQKLKSGVWMRDESVINRNFVNGSAIDEKDD